MNTLSTIAQRRAKEQADRITGADLEAAERDLWAPKRIAGTRVRVSMKGVTCRACGERPAAKRFMCHRCYMRARAA